mgnify:CR=1 FL=1
MMNIYPVVIVYNKSIDNSITLLNLLKCKIPSSNVLVVDNSTSDFGIESYCKEYGYNYLSMQGNKGLSKAYNSAIDFLSGKMKSQDLIMWLDDDTPVTPAYFELLSITATKCNDCDIFMPIIMGQDGVIYSPNEVRIHNVMKSHNLSADDAKLLIIEKDKRYHKRHLALTGSNRGDRHNRDMLIDSSLLGVDGTAELIEDVAKKIMNK